MDPIYVTGHRNPDTDSIVAAMSYAALRNALGDREYEPACLGQVSDETQRVLDRFGFSAPRRITGLHTQIKDLEFDRPPVLSATVTVERAWELLQEDKMQAAIPVANEDSTLFGMLSREDIASYNMSQIDTGVLEEVPINNLLSVLEGRICNDAGEDTDTVAGEVVIALPQSREQLNIRSEQTIMLCGDQPELVKSAMQANVRCLILCQATLPEELVSFPTATCVIGTDLDAYRASRMLFQSTPIGRICRQEDIICFHLEDRVDDVRELVLKHRHPCYPILDQEDHVVGILGRYHLLRPRRKRVVLVDHNEAAQSVPGLEEAEILAIIDHHRLADIQTTAPIYVRNEPVGSTNTIIASMYRDRGVTPSEGMAGMMAAAILSDTVMFKSPTCTERDRQTAQRMARLAHISLDELGREIFSVSADRRTAKELLMADYKEFHIAGFQLAVSQITCMDSPQLLQRREEFLELMKQIATEKGFSMVLLMLTDVLLEGTQLLFIGDEEIICQAFNVLPKDNTVFLPRVMSRKKQVIPMLSALWG